jgi:hypothetical protein
MQADSRWRSIVPGGRGFLRGLLAYGSVVGLLLAAPVIGAWADRHGAPGAIVGVGLVVLLALVSGVIGIRMLPSLRRARSIAACAEAAGLSFKARPRILEGWVRLPSFSATDQEHRLVNMMSGRDEGGEVLVVEDEVEYVTDLNAPVEWRVCTFARIPAMVPAVTIRPRHLASGAHGVGTEWEAFDRRWVVLSHDRKAAITIVDPGLMSFVMDQGRPMTFELGGRWCMISVARDGADRFLANVDLVRAFAMHLPRIVPSLYPDVH